VFQLFTRLRASSLSLSAFECFDRGCVEQVIAHRGVDQAGPLDELGAMQVLIEVEVSVDAESIQDALMELLGEAQEAGELLDAVVAQTQAQAQELWAWREDISESLHAHTPHKADVAVPVREVARFMTRWREAVSATLPELQALCFGHVGDGNLHLNLLRPENLSLDEFLRRCHGFDPIMYGLVREFHGSVSAEHGIGLLKREYLGHTRSPREIDAMRAIKRIFDPLGILNPGKLFGP
jgi:FAD/FMN-containing dehydrogenase